ncbi:DUF6402 family protein [Collimonas silvisoli]|uniref:DUF6402 family protein n=1 Tax=Collimonas silvisoli TaxID=2825884 RepID=UPI001B8BA696|nr:DUF6402 family protein [Collimonas silvisoli]
MYLIHEFRSYSWEFVLALLEVLSHGFSDKNNMTEQAAYQYPVYTDSPTKNYIFYPVFNSDFRKWQMKHKRGWDFLIYPDRKIVYLDNPIVVELEL